MCFTIVMTSIADDPDFNVCCIVKASVFSSIRHRKAGKIAAKTLGRASADLFVRPSVCHVLMFCQDAVSTFR